MNADAVTQTINANVAACIQNASHLGFTRVHNICSGAVVDIPWGSGDWMMGAAIFSFFGVMALFLLAFAFVMIRDTLRGY